jgi:hypothetical protein
MAKKKNNLRLARDLESQAIERFNMNQYKADPRAFRDAITKVTGGIRGIPTQTMQWNRIDP